MPDSQTSFSELSRLQTFFSLATDLFCVAGADGYLERINSAFCKLLGYSEEHLLSQPLLSFLHPDDRARSQNAVDRSLRGEGIPIAIENRWLHQDGSLRWLEWNITPVNGEEGLLFYGVARDNTLRKQAEAETQKLTSALVQRQVLILG